MMYGPYSMTPTLVTPTGLKRPPTPLIRETSFPLADILVVSQQRLSQERDRTYHTFGSLELNVGLKFLSLMGVLNLILEVLNVDFLDMHLGAETTKYKTSHLDECLFHVMLSSKKASLVVHQQV